MMADKDFLTARMAVRAMKNLRDAGRLGEAEAAKAVDALLALAGDSDRREDLRAYAVTVAAGIDARRAMAPFLALLRNKHINGGPPLAEAMGKTGKDNVVASLIAVLESGPKRLAPHAAVLLGRIGNKAAVEPLTKAATSRPRPRASASRAALLQMGVKPPKPER